MKRHLLAALIAVGLGVGNAYAGNNSTAAFYEIKDLIFWSKLDPIYPQWRGFTSVTFTQPLVWDVAGVCNQTTVVVRPEDTHMIAAVQTAFASGVKRACGSTSTTPIGCPEAIASLRAVQY